MQDVLTLLAVGPDGPVLKDPLKDFGFRFDPKTGMWRRIVQFHKKLPPRIARSAVAAECGVAESALELWEAAARGATEAQQQSAAELLAVGPEGSVNPDPLARWAFRFYPRSGVWRRTRADRNEVDRSLVARKVGVDSEVIAAWERAICADTQIGSD
jgi:hypothetical protein